MGFQWRSWRAVLPGISLVLLLAVLHFFGTPRLPSFSGDSRALLFGRIDGWEGERALKCDPKGTEKEAFGFREAPWKADVGCWLSVCGNSTVAIPVLEKVWNNSCELGCHGGGVCNMELAQCRCSVGFSGPGCKTEVALECNRGVTPKKPFGSWRVSMCPAQCDKRTSHCHCGNNTKYPDRPVAEACGFRLKEDGWDVDWTSADVDNVFGNGSYKGWCNLDAKEVLELRIPLKIPQCFCRYDGRWGVLCDIPSESFCINQCNDNGLCLQGFCACRKGWYGIDCSIPSYLPSLEKRPSWLLQANVSSDATNHSFIPATTIKKRPLIYVYDLPAQLSTQLLQGRHFKYHCVNRIYSVDNVTVWTENLYGAGIALYETLLASEHRTINGDEADYFYVPLLLACMVEQADAAPHLSMQGYYMGMRQYFAGDYSRQAYVHIQENYPYWNRSGGRDHIWFFPWDEGACSAPKEIWNSMMLTHWGNTNTKHKTSTTAYFADNWDRIPPEWRGHHPCYDPAKDLVLPAWKFPDFYPIEQDFSARYLCTKTLNISLACRPRQDRPTLFYFNGNLGSAYEGGRPEPEYSMGIRQRVAAEFGSQRDKNGLLGRQAADDVVVQARRSLDYKLELSKSRFCGVFPGDGWSGRMEDSILNGCIPVIIQDGIHLPFENVLNYESFTVRIAEDDIPNLTTILRAINETEVDSMLAAIRGLWQRFTYHRAAKLEAKRQMLKLNIEDPWAAAYNSLTGDDAFSTFVQVLHYKLHTDKWRRELMQPSKNYGIPASCR